MWIAPDILNHMIFASVLNLFALEKHARLNTKSSTSQKTDMLDKKHTEPEFSE